MNDIKLTDQQVTALREVTRAIEELRHRRNAMIDFAVAGAGHDPRPVQITEREDGVYLVAVEPATGD